MSTDFDAYLTQVPADRTSLTDDEHIASIVPLPPPDHLIRFFPIQGTPVEVLIARTRDNVRQILRGQSDRLLVVIGPCSIHDPAAAWTTPGGWPNVRTRAGRRPGNRDARSTSRSRAPRWAGRA